MNEVLRRALLHARLTEEDVASRLEVDPKTVRRWLEGRVPYLRHRGALVSILGLSEMALWPQLEKTPSRPPEVRAIYPNRDAVPREAWLNLFGHARRKIDILCESEQLPTNAPASLSCLDDRIREGTKVRICLQTQGDTGLRDSSAAQLEDWHLPESNKAEIRILGGSAQYCLYRADSDAIVIQHVFGIAAVRTPALKLRRINNHDIAASYFESFERIWMAARSWHNSSKGK